MCTSCFSSKACWWHRKFHASVPVKRGVLHIKLFISEFVQSCLTRTWCPVGKCGGLGMFA